jgi:hypothetical protein
MSPLLNDGLLKHAPETTQTTVMETKLSRRCLLVCQAVENKETKRNTGHSTHARVEARSNTSTVTLRFVGGDEKGSLKCETVKYGRKFQGARTRERLRWQGPVAYKNDRPVLSSERAPHKNKTITLNSNKHRSTPRLTG